MVTEARKKWYAANADRIRRQVREYQSRHKEKYRALDRARQLSIKLATISHYSDNTNKCLLCPESRLYALTIDHINGGGRQERLAEKTPAGWVFYRKLQKAGYPTGYRVLCSNCNWLAYLERQQTTLSISTKAIKSRQWKLQVKTTMMGLLGGKCSTCGLDDIRLLTVHHPNNDGAEHRRALNNNGSTAMYREIIVSGNTKGVECRCFSCNDAEEWASGTGTAIEVVS